MRVNTNPQVTDQFLKLYLQQELAAHARAINALFEEVMPVAAHSAAITADTLVFTGPCVYYGFQVTTATATAAIQIRDGVAAGGGVVIGTINAGTAVGQYPTTTGVYCETGLYVDYAASATGTVVVLFRPV